jgi:hypothetical protein
MGFRWLALALLALAPLETARAQAVRVPAARALPTGEWTPAARRACVDISQLAGAIVVDDRSVELVMRGGARARLRFARACPALGYYGGFYYKQTNRGRLCAGRDQVIGREGSACQIGSITALKRRR